MSEITQIKPQRNNKRVNVYLDGKFGFGLDLENYMKLNIKVGQELSEAEVNKIVQKAEFQKTLDKLLRFGTLRPRSVKEINDWFRKHKVHKSLHKELFNRLKRLELIDDEKFAKWWIVQRLEFRPRGSRALMFELYKKGIDRSIVNQLISELVNQEDELKMAKELLEKKAYKWAKYDGMEKKKKMNEFLARKGFGWDIVSRAVDD
jgi:regulatory protein